MIVAVDCFVKDVLSAKQTQQTQSQQTQQTQTQQEFQDQEEENNDLNEIVSKFFEDLELVQTFVRIIDEEEGKQKYYETIVSKALKQYPLSESLVFARAQVDQVFSQLVPKQENNNNATNTTATTTTTTTNSKVIHSTNSNSKIIHSTNSNSKIIHSTNSNPYKITTMTSVPLFENTNSQPTLVLDLSKKKQPISYERVNSTFPESTKKFLGDLTATPDSVILNHVSFYRHMFSIQLRQRSKRIKEKADPLDFHFGGVESDIWETIALCKQRLGFDPFDVETW